ncbi:hypothetical protein [Nitratifractor salsuginis]|uniref:Lipoprotein n=1 Tax=Nitratifractor salsuginis (strain DSM 16511 / JCM 12458 / E9I37-1) TaxID=749222 RepID=E6X049_NITSE|nr:hypothetical protein [Nitratifractor salsuginis]ADV46772.1 hypothetical protein Nitsa_1524 [Nitratifractor salsuginis DSM 16511]
MRKYIKTGTLIATLLPLIQGCAPSLPPCSPGSQRAGHLCVQGHDFGRVDDPALRQGIRDGCKTGSGTFRKDYRLSASSPNYRAGWIKGRTVCRPQHWSDDPTYSYHPVPRQRRKSSTIRTPDRPLFDESQERSTPQLRQHITDDPEVIRYPD